MLEKLDAFAVARMAARVEAVSKWLRDLQTSILEINLPDVELNTGNFDLYMTEVEKWKKSAEARAEKVFLVEQQKRERERKARERAKNLHAEAAKRKKSS